MGVNLTKTAHVIFFAVILPAVSLSLAWLFYKLFPNLPFWMETLSPLLAYGLLYAWFERSLWKFHIFKISGIVYFPDIHGRWKGKQRSSFRREVANVEVPAYLEICQTFSKITVCAYYERSQSASVVGSFADTTAGTFLFYTYDNEPNSMNEGTMQMHKGTVKLKHLPSEKKLIGGYFNSIGNHGDMDFQFETYDLLCRFLA